MKRPARLPRSTALALLAALLLGGGCATVGRLDESPVRGPFFTAHNFTGVSRLPADLQRVVLLPVAGAPGVPVETLDSLTPVVLAELQRQARFEVVTVDPVSLRRLVGRERLLSSDPLPAHLLDLLAREYGAGGVMFVDLPALSPYPPLALGFRAKLVGAARGNILWAFDQLFSTADPAVANSARRYDRQYHAASDPGDVGYTVLRSPARLGAYASAAAFATLPPR